jgi:hypothetical protein
MLARRGDVAIVKTQLFTAVKRVSEDLFFLLFSRICFYLLEEGFFVVRSASTRRGAQHEGMSLRYSCVQFWTLY